MGKYYRHFTYNDRLRLETLLNGGKHSKKEIAEILGFSRWSVSREMKRGECEQLNSDLTKRIGYSAMIAQEKAERNMETKGPDLKIGKEHEWAEKVEELIVDNKYSPEAALAEMSRLGYEFKICVATLYSYIDKGVFGRLTLKDLPVQRQEKHSNKRKVQKRGTKGTSIEDRPDSVDTREVFGDWEMDTVYGQQGITKKCLLVLTERKTRFERVILMPDRTSKSVIKALNKIERDMGEKGFREMFRTITVDNGSEFSDWEGMEKSRRNKKNRTKIYYCHPYSSYERGSNENANKLIRRHIPKGKDFQDISKKEVQDIEDWINDYPRRMLGMKTARDLYDKELAA